ncbi:MAG: response regulator [Pseudomonadota bacterium]
MQTVPEFKSTDESLHKLNQTLAIYAQTVSAIVREGPAPFKRQLELAGYCHGNASGGDWTGLDLSGEGLTDLDLTNSNLIGTRFDDADIAGAWLHGSRFDQNAFDHARNKHLAHFGRSRSVGASEPERADKIIFVDEQSFASLYDGRVKVWSNSSQLIDVPSFGGGSVAQMSPGPDGSFFVLEKKGVIWRWHRHGVHQHRGNRTEVEGSKLVGISNTLAAIITHDQILEINDLEYEQGSHRPFPDFKARTQPQSYFVSKNGHAIFLSEDGTSFVQVAPEGHYHQRFIHTASPVRELYKLTADEFLTWHSDGSITYWPFHQGPEFLLRESNRFEQKQICVTGGGSVWFIAHEGHLYKVDRDTPHYSRLDLEGAPIIDLQVLSDDSFIAVAQDWKLWLVEDDSVRRISGYDYPIQDVRPLPDGGAIGLDDQGGLYLLDRSRAMFHPTARLPSTIADLAVLDRVRLVSVNKAREMKLWSIAPARQIKGRVLVIEDEDGIRNILASTLTRFGYQTDTAETAEAAIDLIAHQSGKYDLILLDDVIPGQSGPDLILKHIGDLNGTRVVFCGSGVLPATGEEVFDQLNQHFQIEYVPKPFSLKDIQTAMDRLGFDIPHAAQAPKTWQ